MLIFYYIIVYFQDKFILKHNINLLIFYGNSEISEANVKQITPVNLFPSYLTPNHLLPTYFFGFICIMYMYNIM